VELSDSRLFYEQHTAASVLPERVPTKVLEQDIKKIINGGRSKTRTNN
jgi:hypothetical protein